jgi:hypothetical protein
VKQKRFGRSTKHSVTIKQVHQNSSPVSREEHFRFFFGELFNDYVSAQDYWVVGVCPSCGILKNLKEHSDSETGSVSILRRGAGGDTYSVGSLRKR